MDCNDVLEELSEYLDEEAREELCRAIAQHLDQCHDCKVYVDSIKKTIMLYQADRQMEVPPAVSTKLQAVLTREYGSAVEDRSS